MTPVPTCDLYLRLSDLRVEDDFEKRKAKLTAFANALGWTVFRVIVENDLMPARSNGKIPMASAFKRKRIKTPSGRVELRVVRPGFREVLEDITTGRVNGLLAEDLDRIVRDPRDLEDLLDACQQTGASARSISGSLTMTDGGTEAERSMARVLVAMANKASADTARRVSAGRERNWGQSYQGGVRPFGYVASKDTEAHRRTLLVVPDEAAVIKRIAADILDRGYTLKAVLRWLRDENVPTANGGQWNSRTLKQIVTKPTVAGLHAYRGQLKPAPWPAILERDVWERLCERLAANAAPGGASTSNEPRYLLTGIAKCGVCGDGTTVKSNGSGTLRPRPEAGRFTGQQGYECSTKAGHLHRNMARVDALIERRVIEYLDRYAKDALRPPVRKGIDVSALRREAARLRERKTAQIKLHALGELDDDELTTGLRAIRDRLSVVEAQIHASTEADPIPEFRGRPAEMVWKSLPLPRKRAVIRVLMDITLNPPAKRGRVFDADSVVVRLKYPAPGAGANPDD
jgi:DNA invertase Pin-like site-specific DNA recombinase